MRRTPALCLLTLVLAAGCSRPPAAPAFVDYSDEQTGFAIRHPAGWVRDAAGAPGEQRFVPPQSRAGVPAEFIIVFTVPSEGGATEASLRRIVFALLPIHGVSGFQQDPRTTADTLWFKFEVTGSSGGVEWASIGVAVGGASRTQVAICAKPLPAWREGQKQCDEVIRSFQPGSLAGP
ncbi:MAG TPA: hypothetical protein VFJ45_05470 [bacterium]|nr:hypothetical protein [bacterium]